MKLEDFFKEIHKLKHTEREGWKEIGVERPRDTIASHSFGSALIGWTLSEKEGLDTEKTIKALLVHDLLMAYVPDYTPGDEEFESKKELERQKKDELEESLPEEISEEVMELVEEVLEEETDFAKLVKEVDKLETLLQALNYSRETGENHVEEFAESYEDYFKSETGKKMLEKIKDKAEKLSD